MIKVLVVDDHPYVRHSLGEVFAQTEDIHVVAECADGGEVVGAALRTEPDVVLMDLTMPQVPGLEATRQLLAARPTSRVVVLTATVTVDSVCEAHDLGVSGYLIKGENVEELPHLVRAVAAGDSAWSPEAAAHLARCA